MLGSRLHFQEHLLALQQDLYWSAKLTQVRDVWFYVEPTFIWHNDFDSRAIGSITNVCSMSNCLLPEEDRQVGSDSHCSSKIFERAIHLLGNTILRRGIRCRHLHFHAF